MEADPAIYERALERVQPWPMASPLPPFPPLDRGDLMELQAGDHSADQTEALAATAAGARGALDLAVGDAPAAMHLGDCLIRLGPLPLATTPGNSSGSRNAPPRTWRTCRASSTSARSCAPL